MVAAAPQPGEVLGSFRLVRELGRGGMGAVFLAEHTLIQKRAAVKVLLPGKAADPELVRRFFQEARAAARIRHPGMVDVFDYGVRDGGPAYLVMEYLDGESLGARLRRERRLPLDLALDVARQVASALAAAHAEGIVHRDLKPDNLFLCPDETAGHGVRVKVLDFGVAKLVGEPGADLTQSGALVGTPLYMSPEQCRGATAVDARADVYALGVILYHAVCGAPPFTGSGVGDVLAAHIHDPLPPPRRHDSAIPADVEALLLEMLVKDPAARLPTMTAAVARLDELRARPGGTTPAVGLLPTLPSADAIAPVGATPAPATAPRRRRRRWIAAGAAAAVAAAAGALLLSARRDPEARCAAGDGAACVEAAAALEARVEVRSLGDKLANLAQRGCEAGSQDACVRLADLYARGRGVALAFERAVPLYLKACDAGVAEACHRLGSLYLAGNGVTVDPARAAALFERACAGGSARGCALLGQARVEGHGAPWAPEAAMEAFLAGCDRGAIDGCYDGGIRLLHGLGVPADADRGRAMLRRGLALGESACAAGDDESCRYLGMAHFFGRGVELDRARALTFLQRACDLGNAGACSDQASMFIYGAGVPKDAAKGAALLETSCRGGSPSGCSELALAIGFGIGIPPDEPRARRIAEDLCARVGDAGCGPLGLLAEQGRGMPRDDARAVWLIRRACDAGAAISCYNLAARHLAGRGVAKDVDEAKRLARKGCIIDQPLACQLAGSIAYDEHDDAGARRWFEIACEMSGDLGCDGLARIYFKGRGVPADPARGAAILEAACTRGGGAACSHLAVRYLDGADGLDKDIRKALQLHERACEREWADGCMAAAALLSGGTLPADPARAAELRRRACQLHVRHCPADAGP
ncbi:MAG TPA: serine/threonine-protein kinase [Haliangiales bacterium]|nr:serine/threonine-protein kinase [Haliangiales bacterium]